MSEIKGALLGIVLAVAAFGVIFTIITQAMSDSATEIADRMDEASKKTTSTSIAYYLPE